MIPISFKDKGSVSRLYHLLLNIKPKQNNKQIYLANIKAINKWKWCYNNKVRSIHFLKLFEQNMMNLWKSHMFII